jgi:glycosyltransferase involved in cell wall biosynthesis
MPAVIRHCNKIKLLVVGGGPLTLSLIELSNKLRVDRSILFCGIRNDVEKLVALSEFTVLPSLSEGQGLVILESMAGGKPVIASDVGGIPETVVHGLTGFLLPPGDAEMLADKIILLLSDQALLQKMSKASEERAKLFDVNTGAEKTIEVYSQLLKNDKINSIHTTF